MSAVTVQRSSSLSERNISSKDRLTGDVNMNELTEEEGPMELSVILPDRKAQVITVDRSTPMMDLLLQVSSNNKLKPGEHLISIVSEETGRTIDYQSSQSIGSLGVSRIFLLSKAMQKKQKDKEIQRHIDASKFEPTIRVTINLPRGVKSLQRLNPTIPLLELYKRLCIDKGLDPSHYELRITKQPYKPVDMSRSLNDYQANEINIIQCAVPDFHTSMVDISRMNKTENYNSNASKMADPFEKVKKKKGFFSFLRRDKKSKVNLKQDVVDDGGIPKAWKKLESNRSTSLQVLPLQGDLTMSKKPQAQVKPQPKIHSTIAEESEEDIKRNKAKRASSKKKYKAPEPPAPRPLSTLITIKEEKQPSMYSSTPNLMNNYSSLQKPSRRHPVDLHHSRNSSDSSGYHEPPYSPPSMSPPNDQEKKTIVTVQRSQTLPPSSSLELPKGRKKKKAPAPPNQNTQAINGSQKPQLLHDKIVESEEETGSLSSDEEPGLEEQKKSSDGAPEMGILSSATKVNVPPIFIPPPPPPESPPPANSESATRESSTLRNSNMETLVVLHNRSESRCSQASITTIDDVQLGFELAIAAGEIQLQQEQVSPMNEEVSIITNKMADSSDKTTKLNSRASSEPTEADINAAVAAIDLCCADDDGSDNSLVPDGDKYVVAAAQSADRKSSDRKSADSRTSSELFGSVRSTNSVISQSGYVKPVEEISYGFDNPFRGSVPPVQLDESRQFSDRRDSQVSDSTLPDSELTDRPHSSSLQSSGLQSDNEEESVTETGDGYDTGTDKISQSEAENSTNDSRDAPFSIDRYIPKSERRGFMIEAKGKDVNAAIYGDYEPGSIRGVPGQVDNTEDEVKLRTASFTSDDSVSKTEQSRPRSIYNILNTQKVTSDAPKRKTIASTDQLTSGYKSTDKTQLEAEDKEMSSRLYSKPLPVYSRMNRTSVESKEKPATDQIDSSTMSSPSAEPISLSTVIISSVKTGEVNKPMRKAPDSNGQTMFFRAARAPRTEVNTSAVNIARVDNVVKLDSKYETKRNSEPVGNKTQSAINGAETEDKNKTTNLTRKESLKEQYSKLQSSQELKENMAKWQNRLKDNENRVKELTTSQQNLSLHNRQAEYTSRELPKSTSMSNTLSSSSSTAYKSNNQSVPDELHKVTLKSAANRLIERKERELDPVEKLMKSIRDRGGRTSDEAPDRGIYVADGERYKVDEKVATREVAPTVLSNGKINAVPPPPPINDTLKSSSTTKRQSNGTSRANDPRFNPKPSARDNLLAEIASAKGKPAMRRRPAVDSSSQSSSDELKEIEIRQRPPRSNKHKSKRSVSDPFPPQGPSSRNNTQNTNGTNHKSSSKIKFVKPTPTELDPREELMIAIRNSGGLNRLRKVKEDEIKWSAHV